MHLLIFGHGYTAAALTPRLTGAGWTVSGTTRSCPQRFAQSGARAILWPGCDDELRAEIGRADAILIGIGPDVPAGLAKNQAAPADRAQPVDATSGTRSLVSADAPDTVIATFADALRAAPARWVGYLSTTGVYGDHGGGWVDEDTPVRPCGIRGQARVAAEAAWDRLAGESGWRLTSFRLAGIYGPGRGPFEKLRNGTARRIVKPGQVFSRIHVDDIAGAVHASLKGCFDERSDGLAAKPLDCSTSAPAPTADGLNVAADLAQREGAAQPPGNPAVPEEARIVRRQNEQHASDRESGPVTKAKIYNICDDQPAPPEDVIAAAARMLKMPAPPAEAFANAEMSAMAKSFYAESKRVSNRRLKDDLGYRLIFPTYESGLRDILLKEG